MLFGHRRLAIIDLSDAGHQPMVDPETGACIVFNGEIYNYLEVRAELEAAGVQFRSRSDTEVLLKAWLHWGEGCLRRLNGMWAFALWDPATREVVLARDRFGVKPLYWAESRGRILFGSEPKALFALDPALSEPDPGAIWRFMVDSQSHAGPGSFFRHLQALPPAHYARIPVDAPLVRPQRYWSYPLAEAHRLSQSALDEEFTHLINDAVRIRLRSDVPVGLTLSGGLDSSAILAAASRQAAGLHCYTSVYGDRGSGEAKWASLAAERVGAPLEQVLAERGNWLETLDQIVWHMDSPGFSPAVFPLWAIMRRARQSGVPVLLEGQGADELLGGYPQHAALAAVFGSAGQSGRLAILSALQRSSGTSWTALWLARQAMSGLADRYGPRAERVRMMLHDEGRTTSPASAQPDGDDRLRLALNRDHAETILPSLLHYGDAISMAHGIESRLPFMDYRLVEHVYRRQPPLFDAGRTKGPLRRYLARNGMEPIAARQDKQGFPTPLVRWIAEDARDRLDGLMHDANARVWTHLDRRRMAVILSNARAGDYAAAFHSYKFLTLSMWLEQYRALAADPARRCQPAVAA